MKSGLAIGDRAQFRHRIGPQHSVPALYPEAQLEGEVPLQVEFQGFGRIAAQTARQVIVQKVREAERDVVASALRERERSEVGDE